MTDILDDAIALARERLSRRMSAFTGLSQEAVSTVASSLTQTGSVPGPVARAFAQASARMALDSSGFYDAAFLKSDPVHRRVSELKKFFEALLYGRNGLLHWDILSLLQDGRFGEQQLRDLLKRVLRARFARSEATEDVSLEVLSEGRSAAEAIADWLRLRNVSVATLPTRQALSDKLEALTELEPLLDDLSTLEGRYRLADFRGVALRRVLDLSDTDLSSLLHRLQTGEDILDVGPDALASLAALESAVASLLVAPEVFGELLFPQVSAAAYDPPTLQEVRLRPVPEFRYGHQYARMDISITGDFGVFRLDMNAGGDGWYEQDVLLQPLDTREVVADFERVPELVVEGTGTLARTVGFRTGVIVDADGTSPSKYVEIDDISPFTPLNDAANASNETDFWIRVGGEFDGKVFPVSGVSGDNLLLNSDDDPYDWGAEATTSVSDIEDYVGDTCIACWSSDRLTMDGFPAGQLTEFSAAQLSLQFSVRDPMSSLWPFSLEAPLTHTSDVSALGYGSSGSPEDYFGLRFTSAFLPDRKLVDTTWSVDMALTRKTGSRTVKLSQSWSSEEAEVVQRALQGRTVTLRSPTSETNYQVTSVEVVESDYSLYDAVEGDVLVTFSEDVLQPHGSLLVSRGTEAPPPEGEYRWWRVLSPEDDVVSLVPGDKIFVEGAEATVLSSAGDAVLLSRSLPASSISSYLEGKRFRWVSEGDHVVDWGSDDRLTWKVERLSHEGAFVSAAHAPAASLPSGGVISKGLVVAPLARKTRLYAVTDLDDTPADLFSLDRRLRRALGPQERYDTRDASRVRDWTIVVNGEPQEVTRVGRSHVRLETTSSSYDLEAQTGWIVVRTADDGKDLRYQVDEPYALLGEGSIDDRAVADSLVLDLASDVRARVSSGRVQNVEGAYKIVRAAHPVRATYAGPAYRGGPPRFPRWAFLNYRLQRREDRIPDVDELRRVLGRAYADLGETILRAFDGSVTLEPGGLIASLDVDRPASLLPGMEVWIDGMEQEVPPRVQAVLSSSGSVHRVRLSRIAEGMDTEVELEAEVTESTVTDAFRRVLAAYEYLAWLEYPLSHIRPVDRPFLSQIASQLEQAGYAGAADRVRSCDFESWSDPSRYRTTEQDMADALGALLSLLSNQRNAPL